jgi:biotin carboxyl carrier protein
LGIAQFKESNRDCIVLAASRDNRGFSDARSHRNEIKSLKSSGLGADEAGAAGGARTLEAGDLLAIEAPSKGIFFRRPSPVSPPYVDVGSEISTGGVLGLVEIRNSTGSELD